MRAHNHIVLHTIMLFHLGADQFKDGSTLTSSLWVEHFTQLNNEITKMHLPNIYNMLCQNFQAQTSEQKQIICSIDQCMLLWFVNI